MFTKRILLCFILCSINVVLAQDDSNVDSSTVAPFDDSPQSESETQNDLDPTLSPTIAPKEQSDEKCNICGCSDCRFVVTVGNIDFYYPPHERNYRFTCKQLQDKMYNSIAISQDFCKAVIPPLAWEPCRCIDSQGNLLFEHPPPDFQTIDVSTKAPFSTRPPSQHHFIPPPPLPDTKFWYNRPYFWYGVAALFLAFCCCCSACCYTVLKRQGRRQKRRRQHAHDVNQYHDNEGVMLEEQLDDPYANQGYSDHPDEDDFPEGQFAEGTEDLPIYQGEAEFNIDGDDEENEHVLS